MICTLKTAVQLLQDTAADDPELSFLTYRKDPERLDGDAESAAQGTHQLPVFVCI